MPFQPGHSKVGGRKPGTPNVLTAEIRSVLKQIVNDEISTLPERLSQMQPADRTATLLKLLPYVLPQMQSVQHDEGEPVDWSALL